jgi:uncharacterized membrane protein YeiH
MHSLSHWIGIAGTVAFAVTAVLAVAPKGIDLFGATVMGIITAIGGGLIRDVLAGRQNLLMQRQLYAIPVFLGCTLYVVLLALLPEYRFFSSVVCGLFIFGLRAAAIRWDLGVPGWLATKPKTA